MSSIKLNLPGTIVPATGMQINFIAPCNCTEIDSITIDGAAYDVVDTLGHSLVGTGCMWAANALVSVLLDTTNKRAFLLNAGSVGILSPSQYGDALPAPGTPGRIFFRKVSS